MVAASMKFSARSARERLHYPRILNVRHDGARLEQFWPEMAKGSPAEAIDVTVNLVRVSVMPSASRRAEGSPDRPVAEVCAELAEQVSIASGPTYF